MADPEFKIDVFDTGLCGWRCLRDRCGEYAGPYGSEESAESGARWHQRRHVLNEGARVP